MPHSHSLFPIASTKDAQLNDQERENRLHLIRLYQEYSQQSNLTPLDNILTTEKYHPRTHNLSQLAKENLAAAIHALAEVDDLAFQALAKNKELFKLSQEIYDFLSKKQGNIYLSGCGSAGRMANLIALLISHHYPHYQQRIKAIIAGGDASLVKAGEKFEDDAALGIRQLLQNGWQEGDQLICLSASGSANFIHGQLEHAANAAANNKDCPNPIFIISNPISEVESRFSNKAIFTPFKTSLSEDVKKEHLSLRLEPNPIYQHINTYGLSVGPQGLSGSTRMQAATVQFLIAFPIIQALEAIANNKPAVTFAWQQFLKLIQLQLKKCELKQLIPFIKQEAEIYQAKLGIYYYVPASIALNILTDTTERSPTFNQNFMENDLDSIKPSQASIVRLVVKDTTSSEQAWQAILNRNPLSLAWEGIEHTNPARLNGYDLSEKIIGKRRVYLEGLEHKIFSLERQENGFTFKLDESRAQFELAELAELSPALKDLAQQIILKMLINIHSTLVAGRCQFYQSNLMIFVKPSNNKLIDRGIRLTYELVEQIQLQPEHELYPIAKPIFSSKRGRDDLLELIRTKFLQAILELAPNESIVLKTQKMVEVELPLVLQEAEKPSLSTLNL